jgi:hypothetical protein
MPTNDVSVVYFGNIVQVDLLKSWKAMELNACSRMNMLAGEAVCLPEGVKALVAARHVDKASKIVEQFIKDSTT